MSFLFTQKERPKEKAPQTKKQSYPYPTGLSPNKGRIWLFSHRLWICQRTTKEQTWWTQRYLLWTNL